MRLSQVEPVAVHVPGQIYFRGYRHGRCYGSSLLIEWRFVAEQILLGEPAWRWIWKLAVDQTLGNMCRDFRLHEPAWHRPGTHENRPPDVIPEVLTSTGLVIALLFWLLRRPRSTTRKRARDARINLLTAIGELATQGFTNSGQRAGFELGLLSREGIAVGKNDIIQEMDGSLSGFDALVQLYGFDQIWESMPGSTSRLAGCKLKDLLAFLATVGDLPQLPCLDELRRKTLHMAANGFERWLFELHLVERVEAPVLPRLSGRHVDPSENLHLLDTCLRKPGDAAGISYALTGSEHRMKALRHTHNVLHIADTRTAFTEARCFSLAWDPSNYGGTHCCGAVAYAWQVDRASILPPLAAH